MLSKLIFYCCILNAMPIFSFVTDITYDDIYLVGDSLTQNTVEKLVESGTGTGPLALDVLKNNPNVAYIGKIDNKHYYIDRTNATWPEGNDTCNDLGMKMATLHNKSESDYVYSRLKSSDGIVWTGAKIRHNYSHYRWTSDSSSMFRTTLWAFNNTDTVLVFDVRRDTPSSNMFTVSLMDDKELYPICFIKSAD